MYAIYGNIYHQYTPNVSIYIPYMDPMGNDYHGCVRNVGSPKNCRFEPNMLKSKNRAWEQRGPVPIKNNRTDKKSSLSPLSHFTNADLTPFKRPQW